MAELKVCNVSKSFDGRKIIEDISIELKEGEIVSLLGTSGGGKTTLFNVIAGLYEPDTGNVFLNGQNITGKSGHVSYMLQKDLLLPYKTIEDNVSLPLILNGSTRKTAREEVEKYFHEFAAALQLADSVYIAPVFAAWSESGPVDSSALAAAVKGTAVSGDCRQWAEEVLADLPQNSVIAVLGAGDINGVIAHL